ncbi:hypothetical protein INT44_003114, partial [Umbelopsis vinacea]
MNHSKADAIGFIGLGQMGYNMANNLALKAGRPLIVHDVVESTLDKFKDANKDVQIASTPAELADRVGTIITMLPASPHVKEVYFGTDGVMQGLAKDTMVIDSSTIDALVAKELASAIVEKGAVALDAPVSGADDTILQISLSCLGNLAPLGILGAAAGTLTFMVGAESEASFNKAKPLLELMGKNIVYCGANGNGQVAKICNNMLLGISMIAVSETMQLGIRMGMDPKLLANILNTSSGRCWSSDTYNPCPDVIPNTPSCKGYTGGFGNTLMAKDLRLAMNAAQESNSTVLMGALASQVYNRVSNEKEYRGLDFSSVFKVSEAREVHRYR